ncbi:membrane protein insertion efficiency factor YidD [Sutterella sp.]|uniref:membrane protein insertion efficiency factor YidD n=1 Tax=Sutterella sp. TaxID=1981025 RepID=UPI0026DF8BD0|nr:membrane protein insertion efficiency factor YidD [Sutterella sp.]MDO5530434.1 membrane protein insertion efficiency factor YidD [Sutterella sp.]
MNPLQRVMVGLIRLYQITLSPWIGRECRFLPTCSNYAIEAIERHGAFRGGWMTLTRLLRCHPFGGRGYDPVPERFRWRCWCRDCSEKDSGQADGNNPPHKP